MVSTAKWFNRFGCCCFLNASFKVNATGAHSLLASGKIQPCTSCEPNTQRSSSGSGVCRSAEMPNIPQTNGFLQGNRKRYRHCKSTTFISYLTQVLSSWTTTHRTPCGFVGFLDVMINWGWGGAGIMPNVSLATLHDHHMHLMLCYVILTCA